MMSFVAKALFVVGIAFVSRHLFFNSDSSVTLKDKKVLITGASQNIGEEIAYQYARLGAEVVITARREKELERVAKRCVELGARSANYVVADMADSSSYEYTVAQAVGIMGGLDVLVLNHVVSYHGRWNYNRKDGDRATRMMNINYLSYINLANAAMHHLEKSDGQLIVVSSQGGRPGVPNVASYGASKAAINNFFTSLQLENILYKKQSPSITLCILGAIDTKGARLFLAEHSMKLSGYPVEDTAAEIVEGGASRQRLVFIPFFLRFATLLREINPTVHDYLLLRFLFEQ